MNIESLRALCLSFPGTTEDIKWAHYIHQSYELVKATLPKKNRENL